MSSKKRPNQTKRQQARQAQKTHQTNQTLQYAAGAVILLALIVVGWLVASNLNKNRTASKSGTPAAVAKQWTSPPAMTIDTTKQYFAKVVMTKKTAFLIQLFPDKAPITVNNFVFLADKGFYNGVTFHRVLDGFMAQGGDPTGTGAGGPGYEFVNETSDLKFDKAGVVAMANAGRDTNGSQFFITFGPAPQLDGDYTIFGQVTSGMDVVSNLTRRDPDQHPTFLGDVIESVAISE